MKNQIDYGNRHRKRLVALYTLGLLYPFVQSLLYIIGFPHSETVFHTIRPLWMAIMGGCICGLFFLQPDALQRLSVTMWLLVIAMVWMVVRILGDRYLFYEHNPEHIWVRAFAACLFYYPVGRLLTPQEMRRTVGWIAGFWVAAMVFASILGIAASAGGFLLVMPGRANFIGLQEGRLFMGYYCVLTAQNLVLACNLALFLMFSFRKWWVWALCGVSLSVLFVAIGLTDGTNAMLTLGLLLGLSAFVLVTERISPRTWKGLAAGGAAALLVLTLSYNLNTKIIGWLSTPPTREVFVGTQVQPVQTAPAEAPQEASLPAGEALREVRQEERPAEAPEEQAEGTEHRPIDATMHGRTQIWKSTLQSLLTNERNSLLLGVTPLAFSDLIQSPELSYTVNISHNIYLQVVLEWGILGLVIMVMFLTFFAMAAFRLLFGPGIPIWERFLPCMALAFLFSEMADCFCDLNAYTVSLYLMFLFLGMTIGVDFHERNFGDDGRR